MNFKTWQEAKKVKEQDLVFTRALKSPVHTALFNRLADSMAALTPTFSEGLALLETGTELIMMGHEESLFAESHDFERWKNYFQALRFPNTTERDDLARQRFEKFPWPYGSKVKFERRGDKAGVELKLFISNGSDLVKILASLERVKSEIEK